MGRNKSSTNMTEIDEEEEIRDEANESMALTQRMRVGTISVTGSISKMKFAAQNSIKVIPKVKFQDVDNEPLIMTSNDNESEKIKDTDEAF